MDDKKTIEAIASALMGTPLEEARAARPALHLVVNGGTGIQVAAGDIHNYTTINHVEKTPKLIVIIQTAGGVISAQQKRLRPATRRKRREASCWR